MFGFSEKKEKAVSPTALDIDNEAGMKNGTNNYYDPNFSRPVGDIDELNVVCPSHTTEARLMRKIDLRVIPFLCILYLLAFLDRVNIANARSFGLQKELNLQPLDYNTALTIFFVPYIIFEIPSNVLLKKFSPRIWLSGCMFMFGLVSICQGLVQNYGGLLATRFFLGVFEAGMFPGCFYLIGMWYKRSEAQRRYTFFFSSTTLAGAFGGLLASAIGKMDGLRGYKGWRWIFILEGVLTCVLSLAFIVMIPSFPEDATWLTPEERAYVKARLQADQGRSAAERKITIRDIGRVFKDYKVILGGFMYFGMIVPAYGYAFFAPAILSTYNYSPIQTQLHSVPPWACAFAFAMIIAFCSDFAKHRFLFTIIPISIAISGFAILLSVHDNLHVQYAGLFLVAMGAYSAMPVIVCWFNMNLGGHHRRSVGSAWQVGFGNIGGIIATYAFLQKDSPRYTKGYAICLAFLCLSALSCCAYAAAVASQNRKRDRTPVDVGLTEYEKTELGDMSPDYRYLL
ncbi:major facilitator superfamily domain-containing protein [Amylocarpus encephaloides]|uniref:Major facilitator superfamily domain-containing protein n=1 Tax=Amylocarpus encephaloides TaxID=45428 RepID=A0A9P8C3F2_9HELO|nr:major facilitator superfamily domain-containing protein [Amylocarpus encephaloides]